MRWISRAGAEVELPTIYCYAAAAAAERDQLSTFHPSHLFAEVQCRGLPPTALCCSFIYRA